MDIYYLCDRKKCKNCSADCHLTADLSHSINYKNRPKLNELYKNFEQCNDIFYEKEYMCIGNEANIKELCEVFNLLEGDSGDCYDIGDMRCLLEQLTEKGYKIVRCK